MSLNISPTSTLNFSFVDNALGSDDEEYYASEAGLDPEDSPTGLAPNPAPPSENEDPPLATKEMEDAAPAIHEVPGSKKHELFFFEDGSATFIINGTLYCIHGSVLKKHSPYLAETFLVPEVTTPIVLDGIAAAAEFDMFLSILYPSSFSASDVQGVIAWKSVLHLATLWKFSSIRELAIKNLSPIASDVDRVVYGHAYEVEEWLMPGYMALVERKMPITHEEAMRLGMRDMVDIAAAREEVKDVMTRAELRATSSPAVPRKLSRSDLQKRVEAHISRSTMRYPPIIVDTNTATTTPLPMPVVTTQENIAHRPEDPTPAKDVLDEGPIAQNVSGVPECESCAPVNLNPVATSASISMPDDGNKMGGKKGKKKSRICYE